MLSFGSWELLAVLMRGLIAPQNLRFKVSFIFHGIYRRCNKIRFTNICQNVANIKLKVQFLETGSTSNDVKIFSEMFRSVKNTVILISANKP